MLRELAVLESQLKALEQIVIPYKKISYKILVCSRLRKTL